MTAATKDRGARRGALTSYLQSRELEEGVSTTVTSVSISSGLKAVNPAFYWDAAGSICLGIDADDLPPYIQDPVPEDVLDGEVFSPVDNEGLRRLANGATMLEFVTEDAVRTSIKRGAPSSDQTLVFPVRRDGGENAVALFCWRYRVTATITDGGLGAERTLSWFFDDRAAAENMVDTLQRAADEGRSVVLSRDDGRSALRVQEQHDSILDRFSWEDYSIAATVAAPLNTAAFLAWGLIEGSLALLGTGLFFAALTAAIGLRYQTEPAVDDEVPLDRTANSTFISVEMLREELGDTVFEHGGVSSREAVTLAVDETADAIIFSAVGDDRRWRIPTNGAGAVSNDDHMAFLNRVGVDKLEQIEDGGRATFMVGVTGVHSGDEVATLTSVDGDYELFPV